MPPRLAHVNGSVNLTDTATVLRALVERVPVGLRRLPDGETGERSNWLGFQLPRMLATPGLAFAQALPGEASPRVGLEAGVDPDTIAWPDLGYASAYASSYTTFSALRGAGQLPDGVRFQAQYPTPGAVGELLMTPQDRDRLLPSYRRALLADLDDLQGRVPHEDLAVQWDAPIETVTVESAPQALPAVADGLGALLDRVHGDVPVGVHLCYGDLGHVHLIEPSTLAPQVALANALLGRQGRAPSWVSLTVPQDRTDAEFFAPLADLRAGQETEVYLGLVPYHAEAQAPGATDEQVALVDRYLPSGSGPWGISTECGMGRVDAADVPALLDLHRTILQRYAEA